MTRHNDRRVSFYPDGLTTEIVEALLDEARPHWDQPVIATAALVDGSALQRRDRRIARRAMGAVVRALPARSPQLVSDDAVA